jgi:hypothetical protein
VTLAAAGYPPCPYCGRRPKAWISRGPRPSRGDVAACSHCLGWSVYEANWLGELQLRPPTFAERREHEQNSDLIELLVAVQIHEDPRQAITWWKAVTQTS